MENFEKSSYLFNVRPALNREAMFSDTSCNYIEPWNPKPYGLVKIKFRTARNNVDYVYLVCDGEKYMMEKSLTERCCDFYEYEVQLDTDIISYYFEITGGNMSCQYDARGVVAKADPEFYFRLAPGFETPKWAKGAVFYQIFVDRFYNGDKTNDVLTNEYKYIGENTIKVEDWYKYPAAMGVREFYGGDLQGVIDKMDYLEKLGIDAIYFNPLFVSPSNHKYDIQDYDYIDPHFGRIVDDKGELLVDGRKDNKDATRYINRVTNRKNLEASNELFIKVVEEAHKRGIKVIIDGVFNHCGSFNKWMDRERIYEGCANYEKGAYISDDSPYRDFFSFYNENGWPYNGSYDGWWGHDTLPKLNYEGSRKLYDYILEIARKWVSPPYNVDGWRLDVAADLGHSSDFNHKFWKEFRRTVKQANPEAIIIAEHYGDPEPWLKGDEWDTVMNYDAFMEPVTWFLTGMQKHSDDYRSDMLGNADNFINAMSWNMNRLTSQSMYAAMNELSNHDHSRFLTRTNHVVGRVADKGPEAANNGVNKAVMREAVMVQMTWVGAPTIYYGDEAGLCGFTDPDNRRSYPWGREDKELIGYHREMIRIHKENEELKTGSIRMLYKDYNVIAYGRFNHESQCVIVINNNDCEKEVSFRIGYQLSTAKEFVAEALILSDKEGFSTEGEVYPSDNGRISIHMSNYSAILLKIKSFD